MHLTGHKSNEIRMLNHTGQEIQIKILGQFWPACGTID